MQYKPTFVHGDTVQLTYLLTPLEVRVLTEAMAFHGLQVHAIPEQTDHATTLIITLLPDTPPSKLFDALRIATITLRGDDYKSIR
jgi:hypothetical protein